MFSERVYVVAGGGHGLGRATARELGRLGASVVVNDLGTTVEGDGSDPAPGKETVHLIRDDNGTALPHFGDVTSLDYTRGLLEDTYDEFGRVDGVVNFAGVLRDSRIHSMTATAWDQVIRVHLRGHFSLLRAATRHWRERADDTGGELSPQRSFIALSSEAAMGNFGQLNYAAAKAGILGLMRTAAIELYPKNVRVNAVMPRARTRAAETIPDEKQPDDPPPESVAPTIAFLLTDAAEDVTGCTIWATGEHVGVVTGLDVTRTAYKSDGWDIECLIHHFQKVFGDGDVLTNIDSLF